MLSEILNYYSLNKDFAAAGYFETEVQHQLGKDFKTALKLGGLILVSGPVGCGKTTFLRRLQEQLEAEKEILVSKSLAVDKARVNLGILILALFYDLATEKEFKVPSQPEKRERKLRELIRKRQKPVALFIDEAHDLHGKTLIGLKRLMEVIQDGGGTLAIVLAGHPKLKNELRRSTMEEIGSRATVFSLASKADLPNYLEWLLKGCTRARTKRAELLTDEAATLLTTRLTTPLQIQHYLRLAFEEGYKIGQRPVSVEVLEQVLSPDLDALEARLTRSGYTVKTIAEMLNARQAEIRSLFRGQLPPTRAQELKNELMAAGIPI